MIERVGCHETCQKKYQNNEYGPLCDKVDVGTTACLQPERGVLLDGFITPVLEEGDHFLALNERSN